MPRTGMLQLQGILCNIKYLCFFCESYYTRQANTKQGWYVEVEDSVFIAELEHNSDPELKSSQSVSRNSR